MALKIMIALFLPFKYSKDNSSFTSTMWCVFYVKPGRRLVIEIYVHEHRFVLLVLQMVFEPAE